MPNSRYQAGRRGEWAVRDAYRKCGFKVVRSAGSKSDIDLIALDDTTGITYIIQVKTTKNGDLAEAGRLWRAFCSNPPTRACPNFRRVLWVKLRRKLGWRSYHME